MSGQWIDIPAHRVWVVPGAEIRTAYELFGEDGEPCQEGRYIYRVRRKEDGKLYRTSRVYGGLVSVQAGATDHMTLEEV